MDIRQVRSAVRSWLKPPQEHDPHTTVALSARCSAPKLGGPSPEAASPPMGYYPTGRADDGCAGRRPGPRRGLLVLARCRDVPRCDRPDARPRIRGPRWWSTRSATRRSDGSERWRRCWAESTRWSSPAASGENTPAGRASICDGLRFFGITIDALLNRRGVAMVSKVSSPVDVRVIAIDRERMTARSVMCVVRPRHPSKRRWTGFHPISGAGRRAHGVDHAFHRKSQIGRAHV